MLRASDVLGPGSPLAKSLRGYEERGAQLAMADAVEAALLAERPLFVEAGTGTGKTLAYLVPAILSGKKVVVSTATRALQEQIFTKDLPIVESALKAHGVTFRATLMKGLTNYLCKRRLHELAKTEGFGWSDPRSAEIHEWAKTTEAGDRAELATLPEDAGAWLKVQSSTETRIGGACPFFDECFVTRMRREADLAEIVVVNHHLFFADLALRVGKRGDYASAIPNYDAVIFDEAHQIEDIATDFFGVRLSTARIDALTRDAERSFASNRAGTAGPPPRLLEQANVSAHAFFDALGGREARAEAKRLLTRDDWSEGALSAGAKLDASLEAIALYAEGVAPRKEALALVARRARDARADLREVIDGSRRTRGPEEDPSDEDLEEPAPRVAWIQAGRRSVSVGSSPVELDGVLRAALFDRVPSVICTSATLATAKRSVASCHFSKARLGAPPDTDELVVPSPFDFASRAALYLPSDLPDPGDSAFESAAVHRIVELVGITGGGAFVLCTSTRAMARIHQGLAARLKPTPLVQGDAPKHVLLDRFRSQGDAVLVATMSFWEGVDVPGRALRLVILDKIPFAVPTDPVVLARCALLDRNGGNAFAEYSVPSAAITLKQGFGRLLRTERDAGIVAILDPRMTTRGYGKSLLASLPAARRVSSLDDVRSFWSAVDGAP
jgi:ATP-dependent DNA helicase DinG